MHLYALLLEIPRSTADNWAPPPNANQGSGLCIHQKAFELNQGCRSNICTKLDSSLCSYFCSNFPIYGSIFWRKIHYQHGSDTKGKVLFGHKSKGEEEKTVDTITKKAANFFTKQGKKHSSIQDQGRQQYIGNNRYKSGPNPIQ